MNAIKYHSVTPQQERLIRDELREGEYPLFLAPVMGGLSHSLFLMIFAVFWISFSLFFFVAALRQASETTPFPSSLLDGGVLFSLIFVVIGVAVLFLPIALMKSFRHTIVAFTNRRLIVGRKDKLMSVPLDDIRCFVLSEEANRSGSFAVDTERPVFNDILGFSSSSCPRFMLGHFPDIRSIERLIRSYCLPPDKVMQPDASVPEDKAHIPHGTRNLIDAFMDDGERVLFVEKPVVPGVALRLVIMIVICCILSAIAAGIVTAVQQEGGSPLLISLIVATASVIVLAVLFPACYSRRKWRNTTYVITNKRAVVLKAKMFGKTEVVSYPADKMELVEWKKRRNGGGDLVLHERVYKSDEGDTRIKEGMMRLPDLEKARHIFDSIRALYHERH